MSELTERLRALLESPAYRLAFEDEDLPQQDDLRPMRLQLELLKPERAPSRRPGTRGRSYADTAPA